MDNDYDNDNDTRTDTASASEGSSASVTDNQSYSGAEMAATAPAAQAAPQAAPATDDAGDHKLYAILGYILPFLFFLPLLSESSKKNAFARFHANQQLILLIIVVGLYAIHNVLYIVLMSAGIFVIQLLNLAILALAIFGIVNAAQGRMKELPLVGKFNLLK